MKIGFKRFLFVMTMIVYLMLFHVLYVKILVGYFCPYCPNEQAEFFWMVLFTSVALLPAIWLPIDVKKPSSLFFFIFYLTAFIPVCYLSMHSPLLSKDNFFTKAFVAGLSFFLVYIASNFFEPFRLKFVRIRSSILWGTLLFLTILVLVFLVVKYRDIMHFVGLSEVYEQRAIYAALVVPRSILSYSFNFLGGAIFPFFIIYGLYLMPKRWVLFFFGVIGQTLLYCIAAAKITLFSIFFIPMLMLFFERRAERVSLLKIMWCVIGVILGSAFICLVCNYELPFDMIFRRTLVVGNISTIWHWAFFDSRPFVYLSYTFLNPFLHYPYSHGIPVEVGYFIFGRYADANANYLAGAYANFGLIGMMIYSLILGYILYIFDNITRYWPKNVAYTVIVWAGYNFASTDLFTTLLTHGFLLWLLLLYLFVPQKQEQNI